MHAVFLQYECYIIFCIEFSDDCLGSHLFYTLYKIAKTKAKSNYRGSAENPATQKFYIHFFMDNSNVNFILYTLSCPKLKSGQLKVYKLMFALELSMKK